MNKITLILITFATLGLLTLPLIMPNCGTGGLHIGWTFGSDCQAGTLGMTMDHISEMTSMQVGTLVSILLTAVAVFFLVVVKVFILSGLFHSTIRTDSQGIGSYYYLMKPFDRLLFLLTKIHKKHFVTF